ncbi:MAG: hypothetical protein A4E69_02979 [Syntrophus sp. PtaB.Bin138]|nr:MAG: hypothetical protein A4E69_02979 [Syntrophus sp. PtaB.Bin138]
MIGGVLGLGVDGYRAAEFGALRLGQVENLLHRRDPELAVVLLGSLGVRDHGAQRLDLCQGEVVGEPARLLLAVHRPVHSPAAGEFRFGGHVGAGREVWVVARDQHPVLGRDEIGLDHLGALIDGQLIGLQRVLGQIARRAAVPDDQRRLAVKRRNGFLSSGHGRGTCRRGIGGQADRREENYERQDDREDKHCRDAAHDQPMAHCVLPSSGGQFLHDAFLPIFTHQDLPHLFMLKYKT